LLKNVSYFSKALIVGLSSPSTAVFFTASILAPLVAESGHSTAYKVGT